jgi:hypothetical protein
MSDMKSSGGVNFGHIIPWTGTQAYDAILQEKQKPGMALYRLGKKLATLSRRAVKLGKASAVQRRDGEEIRLDPGLAKFPFGNGLFFCLYRPSGPSLDGPPLPPIWRAHHCGDLELVLAWKEELGRWHAGYPSKSKSKRGHMRPEFFPVDSKGTQDMRFYEGTFSLPKWDSSALSESWKAGEVMPEEFDDLLQRLLKRLTDGKLERLASCGAKSRLRLVGLAVHPQNGTLHVHPVFIKVEMLAFAKADGRLLPAGHDEIPGGGRRKAGAEWVGGNRLGHIGKRGRLVTNTLGPDACATIAERKEKIPPGLQHGDNWKLNNLILESRLGIKAVGKRSTLEGQNVRARESRLGEPYDNYGSRAFRDEVAKLAKRNTAFMERRKAAIAQAVADRLGDNRALVRLVAGKTIAELEKANAALKAALEGIKDLKAIPQFELTGHLEVDDGETVPVLLAPTYLRMWLTQANGLLLEGRSLDSMSAQARQAVEIKPSTGPSGGRVGLTPKALRIVGKAIFELDAAVRDPATAQVAREDAQKALKAYRAAEAANNASLGIPEGDKGRVSPVFNPEQLVIWLGEAIALVLDGRDLSSMPAHARLAVEIKPNSGLTAGRVGLTKRALLFVESGIVELENVLKGSTGNPREVNRVAELLGAFREAIDAHRHYMGEDQEQPKDLPLVTDPVKLREYLSHANTLARGGYDLSSMPREALAAVEIKPDGRVGLTVRQLRLVKKTANELEDAIVDPGATPAAIKDAKARLLAFRLVFVDNDASMGVGKQSMTPENSPGVPKRAAEFPGR